MTTQKLKTGYRDIQFLRMAMWSVGVVDEHFAVIKAAVDRGPRNSIEDAQLEIVASRRDLIVRQYQWSGDCVNLGSMSGRCDLCDHAIKYVFNLVNAKAGRAFGVGSNCIVNYVDAGLKERVNDARARLNNPVAVRQTTLLDHAFELTGEGDQVVNYLNQMRSDLVRWGTLTPNKEQAIQNIIDARL